MNEQEAAQVRRRILQLARRRGREKYPSRRRIVYDGVRYDSKAEASRAQDLDRLVLAGEVLTWFRQVTVRLGVPENVYRVDFLVIPKTGTPWCEDVKGHETSKFKRDKLLWRKYARIPLHIIKRRATVEIIEPERHR